MANKHNQYQSTSSSSSTMSTTSSISVSKECTLLKEPDKDSGIAVENDTGFNWKLGNEKPNKRASDTESVEPEEEGDVKLIVEVDAVAVSPESENCVIDCEPNFDFEKESYDTEDPEENGDVEFVEADALVFSMGYGSCVIDSEPDFENQPTARTAMPTTNPTSRPTDSPEANAIQPAAEVVQQNFYQLIRSAKHCRNVSLEQISSLEQSNAMLRCKVKGLTLEVERLAEENAMMKEAERSRAVEEDARIAQVHQLEENLKQAVQKVYDYQQKLEELTREGVTADTSPSFLPDYVKDLSLDATKADSGQSMQGIVGSIKENETLQAGHLKQEPNNNVSSEENLNAE